VSVVAQDMPSAYSETKGICARVPPAILGNADGVASLRTMGSRLSVTILSTLDCSDDENTDHVSLFDYATSSKVFPGGLSSHGGSHLLPDTVRFADCLGR
jgi:hypothetical protein